MKKLIPEIIEPWFFVPNGDFCSKVANDYKKPETGFLSIIKKFLRLFHRSKHVDNTI